MTLSNILIANTALLALLLAGQVITRSLAHGLSFALSSLDREVVASTIEPRRMDLRHLVVVLLHLLLA